MNKIPDSHKDLLADEKRAFCFLGTQMADGTPQVTPVWFNFADNLLWVNSAKGRLKDKNMRKRPGVSLCIQDPDNPYRYLQVRGRVITITEDGANDHIDALAGKYTGNFNYQGYKPGMQRVIYKIAPEKVDAHG